MHRIAMSRSIFFSPLSTDGRHFADFATSRHPLRDGMCMVHRGHTCGSV